MGLTVGHAVDPGSIGLGVMGARVGLVVGGREGFKEGR